MNLTITQRVLAFLKLDDEGRINSFYLKQQAQLNKDIKNLNKNLGTLEDQHQENVETLQEKLDDAEVRVTEAYEGVTPNDVANNEKASDFSEVYWRRVESAEEVVANLIKSIENEKEAYAKRVESVKAQITERTRRLSKLA